MPDGGAEPANPNLPPSNAKPPPIDAGADADVVPSAGADAGADAKADAAAPDLDAGSDAAPSDPACFATTTLNDCYVCCSALYPPGADIYNDSIAACVCQPSHCATLCEASYCAGIDPVLWDACDQCVSDATACVTGAREICRTAPNCQTFFSCSNTSRCDQKP